MANLKKEGKIALLFVLIGNPLGIFLFWVGMNLIIPSSNKPITLENLFHELIGGVISSPVAIFFGSIAGIPLSFLNSLVFIGLTKSKIGKENLLASGAFSGALILTFLYISSYFYDVHYLGLIRENREVEFAVIAWLILSSSITGLVLAKALENDIRKIYEPSSA